MAAGCQSESLMHEESVLRMVAMETSMSDLKQCLQVQYSTHYLAMETSMSDLKQCLQSTGTVQHSLPGHGDQHVRPQAVPAGTSLPVLQVLTTWKTGILITFPVGWSEKYTWSTAFVHIRKSRQNAKSLHPIPQQLCHFTVLLSYQCTTAITTTLCSSTFLPVHGNHDTLHLYLLYQCLVALILI